MRRTPRRQRGESASSAADSAASAKKAEDAAEKAAAAAVADATAKLKGYVEKAEKGASDAASSAAAAKGSAGDASASAGESAKSATEASTSAGEARKSASAAAGSASSASTSADEASTSAGEAKKSAQEAKSAAGKAGEAAATADAAAQKASDIEAKLGGNILKDKVKDTLIHVDDAFPSNLLGIEIEGACKQDGEPSPDNPVPIQVIENPVLRVTGKNILSYPFAFKHATQETINGITFTDNGDGSISVKGTNTTASIAYYNLDFTSNARQLIGKTVYISRYLAKDAIIFSVSLFFEDGTFKPFLNNNTAFTGKVPENATTLRVFISVTKGTTVDTTIWPYVYVADEDDEYTPYTSQEQAFTLPAEHPYLAKIGDVADEIKVDRDGNVSLIARITKTLPSNEQISWDAGTETDSAYASYKVDGIANVKGISCNSYIVSNWTNKSGYIYCPNGIDIAIRDNRFTSKEKAIELLDGVIVYVETTEKTYSMGKITPPALPESISNVWTDAELIPNTAIEYTKDINIVVARIEDAIASIG